MPSPGLRVIHRSTLQEAIEERAGEKKKERPENKSEEQNKKNPEEQGSKGTEEDDKENEKLEDQDKEKAERQEKENTTEEVREGGFLKEILEALEAAKGKPKKKESSKSQAGKNIVDSSPEIEIETNGKEREDEKKK